MAGVDYYSILEAVRTVIATAVPTARVALEVETIPAAELCPFVAIYLDEHRADAAHQPMMAGQRTYFELRISIWCFQMSIESLSRAKELAWDLVNLVEVALMGNRTLSGAVRGSWLDGGAMDLERGSQGSWIGSGEVVLVAQVVSSV